MPNRAWPELGRELGPSLAHFRPSPWPEVKTGTLAIRAKPRLTWVSAWPGELGRNCLAAISGQARDSVLGRLALLRRDVPVGQARPPRSEASLGRGFQ